MSEGKVERSFRRYRQALGIVSGIAIALVISVFSGDYGFSIAIPVGAASLWLITTIYCILVGFRLALGSRYDEIPFVERRSIAVGYLFVGFINLISMGAFNFTMTGDYGGFIYVSIYGAMLIYAFSRLFESDKRYQENDDLFP